MSVSCQSSVCECVSSQKTRFPVDWGLLVEECIAYIGIPLDIFRFLLFQYFFLRLKIFLDIWLFANQATVHNGVVSRGGCTSVAVAVGASDK